jgi:hypothetical protein
MWGVAAYPMTFNSLLSTWTSTDCICVIKLPIEPHITFMRVIIRTTRNPFFRDQIVKRLKPAFKVYAPYTLFCIKTSHSWIILNSSLTGDTITITWEIFIFKFGQELKFLFVMQELQLCVTPWKVSSSYKNILIHLTCMLIFWNIGL